MLVGSEEKIMCHTSARFQVIILITWTSDTKDESKNKIADKYITSLLGDKKNPHKDIFHACNKSFYITPRFPKMSTLLNPMKRHHRHN